MSDVNDQRIYDRCIIRVGQLEAENTKLRELVKDMLDVMLDYRCDIRMPNSLDCSDEPAVFKERARELGIEVDE